MGIYTWGTIGHQQAPEGLIDTKRALLTPKSLLDVRSLRLLVNSVSMAFLRNEMYHKKGLLGFQLEVLSSSPAKKLANHLFFLNIK